MTQVRRVFEYLLDKEPINTDHENKLVILGQEYSPDPQLRVNLESAGVATNEIDDGTNSKTKETAYHLGTSPNINANNKADLSQQQSPNDQSSSPNLTGWPDDFVSDVESRIWLTYRQNFSLIERAANGPGPVSISNISNILRGNGLDMSGFTSDAGWGCMIRTSQSLLANTMLILQLGRDWRRKHNKHLVQPHGEDGHTVDSSISSKEEPIVRLFADIPSAPFSLHKIVAHGRDYCGKMPGQWFGPSAAASSIKHLVEQHSQSCKDTSDTLPLHVYISNGADVYEDQLMKTATANGTRPAFEPTLVLLGVRLGTDKFNSIYWPNLQRILSSKFAVGIAGGRPSASHYFYGYQGEYLFYQDPHKCQPCLKPDSETGVIDGEALDTCHSGRIRKLHFSDMDPSMLIGIFLRDSAEYHEWRAEMHLLQTQRGSIVTISEREPVLRRSSLSIGSDDGFIEVGNEDEDNLDVETEAGKGHEVESHDDLSTSNELAIDQVLAGSSTGSYMNTSAGDEHHSDGSYIHGDLASEDDVDDEHDDGYNGSPNIQIQKKRQRSPPEMVARSFDCVEVTKGGMRRATSNESYDKMDSDDGEEGDSFGGILV